MSISVSRVKLPNLGPVVVVTGTTNIEVLPETMVLSVTLIPVQTPRVRPLLSVSEGIRIYLIRGSNMDKLIKSTCSSEEVLTCCKDVNTLLSETEPIPDKGIISSSGSSSQKK